MTSTAKDVQVLDSTMRYAETGTGRPVLLLHGNPTSSYLWREVVPRLPGRRIALDLIGMGGSGKPDIGYRLADHIRYVEAFTDAVGLDDFVLAAHDWGVAIGFEYLRRHPGRVAAFAFMEGHVRPVPGWHRFDEGGREIFQALRTPGVGERMVLEENFMIDKLLPGGMHRDLTEAELAVYREPYPDARSRRPLLQWAREIPVEGEPADVAELLTEALEHAAGTPIPKLLVHGEPGAVIDAENVEWCRSRLPGLEVAGVGTASHFLPEDRPAEVADALASWIGT